MGKQYLIDTNAAVDYLDNKLPPEANALIDKIESRISIITRIELLSWPNATMQQTSVLEEFIRNSHVYNFQEPMVQNTIGLRKKYRIKLPDAIIAATAIANDQILITRDTKDFNKIEELQIINPHDL
ncbi:MAG: type II toxin-antitoxin system VapC family toxin [Marinilabiliaceae bacterium]